MYNRNYLEQFNPDVIKDLSKLHEEIEDEKKNEKPDKEKLLKLEMQQLLRGMELNTGTYNNYRKNIPW